ncbi:branched-chain amino acid ABC transporter ATP-binding protein/permease [Ensifer sp.]|jgi:branched-chain amino acid transport system permease protein|uniref:branched-chain amino acid ABC transporter ATP-binding protein/permease n=1 Tax=Ensifer sp. TaxID=1872086 RepID=UPI002E1116A6|nr:branched-chain amino acid ABC transporter ATP-binding protein/permease [Ensifer sp.]
MKRSLLSLGGLLLLVAAPFAAPNAYYVHMLTVVLIFAIALMGLDFIIGYVGQISLGHFGLFAIGSYAGGLTAADAGLSLLPALGFAVAVTALFGAVLAFPALKTAGPYFAMVTLAFGSIAVIVINEWTELTGGARGLAVPKPLLGTSVLDGRGFYWFALGVFALAWITVGRIISSRYGRAFEALQSSAIATDSIGISSFGYKVLAFTLSAGFTGLAGGLYAFSELYITPQSFNFELTIVFLLALIVGGRASRPGAFAGALLAVWLPNLLADMTTFRVIAVTTTLTLFVLAVWRSGRGRPDWRVWLPVAITFAVTILSFQLTSMIDQRLTIFGLILLGAITYLPNGIIGTLLAGRTGRAAAIGTVRQAGHALPTTVVGEDGGKALELGDVTVAFGGLTAINSLSVEVEAGTVHGLIGPNGAGKSTLLNVLTGIYRPSKGVVRLRGRQINGVSTVGIARAGVSRTFQNIQLFGQLTALENVLVGRHRSYRTGALDMLLATPRYKREELEQTAVAMALLDLVGLSSLAGENARNLPYGKQRLLEIARALATGSAILLLDEPAAGLNPSEVQELVTILETIKRTGITMVLIEHHMDVVMALSDRVTVLDFGEKIAEGPPQSISADGRVVDAYLGTSLAVA